MKAVQLLVQSTLPEDLQREEYGMDARSMGDLMAEVARRHPDKYEEISKQLSDAGLYSSYIQGETLGLEDLKPVVDKEKIFAKMDAELALAKKAAKNDEDYRKQRLAIWARYSDEIEKVTMEESLRRGNNLGYSVASGARGKPTQLKMMLTTPGLYTDANDNVIPLFVRNSFGQGLRPHEYLAGTYGARKSVLATKRATAKGGFLAKQMVQASSPMMVTESDCGSSNGIDLDIHDKSLKNRVLAREVNGLPAGTVLDRAAITDLKKRGVENVVVRSALTCETGSGICAHCVGKNAEGKFPPIGEAVGISAAQAIGEPITQGALNCLMEGTMVRMADFSVRPIETLVVGDMVLGSDLEGNTFPTRVDAVWDQGLQPVQRRYFKMGQTEQLIHLDSTSCHPILANTKTYGKTNGKMNYVAQKLDAGKPHVNFAAVLPRSVAVPGKEEPWAVMLGVLLGDGNRWTGDNDETPSMSCADESEIEHLREILLPLNVGLNKNKRSHDWRLVMLEDSDIPRSTDGRVVSGVRSPIKKKIIEWDLQGKYAHEKRLPSVALRWSQESCAAILAGFIATDGSVFKNKAGHVGISFASCSRGLLEDLKDLLRLKLCVYSSSITKTGKKGEGNRIHDMWQFTITRQDQLLQLFPHIKALIPGVKRERLSSYLENVSYELRNPDPFYRAKRVETEDLGVHQCWDISVANADSLFVLENGLIVKNTKHTGGVGGGAKREYSGFDWINQFLQTPSQFKDRAVVAEKDGRVERIEEAPQGGTYVTVAGERYYVQPGFEVEVKEGQVLEAGDQLSAGLINPADVVRLRGLGEGRRYFADRLKRMLDDSGMEADRRSTEMLARSAINHVTIEDLDDPSGYLPDDVVSYNKYLRDYVPSEDTEPLAPSKAVGKILQAPALHYSIGTRVTPSMAKRLEDSKWDRIQVSSQEPKFTPQMVRLQSASHNNPDWLAQQHTSYLKRQLSDSAARGQDTNIERNVHFAPRLAVGQDFGKNVRERGEF